MTRTVYPSSPTGRIKAVASKSVAHRLLICAAFADAETTIRCEEINDDISATVRCLCALGANITRDGVCYRVSPIQQLQHQPLLDCGESGSTLRFLLPVACILGADASFAASGRLPDRPLSPLREELERGGVTLSLPGSRPLVSHGKLSLTDFRISGSVSSQFISGLLFALAVSGQRGTLTVEGTLESAPYVDMTADALRLFGVAVEKTERGYAINKNDGLHSPAEVLVEGDWSGAAFPLCLGALGTKPVTVRGLNPASRQGDRAILSLLRQFGATVTESDNEVTVSPATLHGISIDASQIPDLVPILATVASVAKGRTVIKNAARLRLKESDRLTTVRTVLNSLGASVTELDDGLLIEGVSRLQGGTVSSFGDHRIAMSAAVASVACLSPVTVECAEATAKSYPSFWEDLVRLGVDVK